jgi:hypothetical protein
MLKLAKIEYSSDLDENRYATDIFHIDRGKNKQKISLEKLTYLGGHSTLTPTPKLTKIENLSDFNENRYTLLLFCMLIMGKISKIFQG